MQKSKSQVKSNPTGSRFQRQQNYFKSFEFYAVVFSFSLFAFSLAMPAFAAFLYLEPTSGEYHLGDTFIVEIKLDTEDKCINTVEAELKYPQDILKAVDFSRGDSILTLWLQSPKIDQDSGLISFSGGIPGGYCGKIPGDPGVSNLLGKIIFQVQKLAENRSLEIEFVDNSQVLLNDGKGTPAKLTTKGAVFTILAEPFDYAQGKDEWQEELEKDKIPPEPFVIEVCQDPALFDGKYFLIFSTTDKQTGLDYFEIKEGDRDWKKGVAPYLLEDQDLQSIIKVKAIDKAGNERIVDVGPIKSLPPAGKKPFLWWIIVIIGVVIGVIWWIVRKIIVKLIGIYEPRN